MNPPPVPASPGLPWASQEASIRPGTLWTVGVLLAVLVGLAARLSVFWEPGERLLWQYMTEDGYLMQTVARNMAIGLGMSTAEGTMATNGVQPLATFLFSSFHAIADGHKVVALAWVAAFSLVVSALAAWLFFRVVRNVLPDTPSWQVLAAPVAVLWFAAPHLVAHSMNGLETSLYWLFVLLALLAYQGITGAATQPMSWGQRVGFGAVLGLAFLARNDAVFFIAAILLAHWLIASGQAWDHARTRFLDCLVAGLTSILVASPWLVHNQVRFGSIVPVSGTAQSHFAEIGANLVRVPATLLEHALLFAPIPGRFETHPVVVAGALLVLALVAGVFWQVVGRRSALTRRYSLMAVLFIVPMSAYYGTFFGADWFFPRYFSVFSPFLWLAVAVTFWAACLRVVSQGMRGSAGALAVAGCLLIAAAFAGQGFLQGKTHMHRQVVDWVDRHVPDEVWAGAVQTGTLGYFHDRTINLDGKVNPAALTELLSKGHVLDYVVSSPIGVIADWRGVADWPTQPHSPAFSTQFSTVVDDPVLNLGVLRRDGTPLRDWP